MDNTYDIDETTMKGCDLKQAIKSQIIEYVTHIFEQNDIDINTFIPEEKKNEVDPLRSSNAFSIKLQQCFND